MLKKLFGGSEKTKSVRLGVNAYGKLPIYKDFISCGMTDAPAREFRAWIDKGFSHRWANDEACAGVEIPPCSFLLRMPESRGYAAGSLWGSADEGGLRKFPFALFLSFPRDNSASDPVAAVEYLGDLERRASELRFVFGPGASLTSFYQSYRGTEIEIAVKPRSEVAREMKSELSDFTIAEFAESLFGDASAGAWPQLLASAGSLADAAAGASGALRIPLSGRLPRAREVEFWLFWLEHRDPKGKRAPVGLLYPHGHNPGRAVIFFRELKPEDFLLLHPTRSDLPAVSEALAGVKGGESALAAGRRKAARTTPAPADAIPREPAPEPAAPPAPPAAPEPAPAEEIAPAAETAAMPAAMPAAEPAAAALAPNPPESLAAPPPPAAEPTPEGPAAEAAPFPEAEIPRDTTGGARLSAIIALDPNASGALSVSNDAARAPDPAASDATTVSAAPPAPLAPPEPVSDAAPPAEPPAPPPTPVETAPATPRAPEPAIAPEPPPAPAAPPPARPAPPPPPLPAPAATAPPPPPLPKEWSRPLPSLLEA